MLILFCILSAFVFGYVLVRVVGGVLISFAWIALLLLLIPLGVYRRLTGHIALRQEISEDPTPVRSLYLDEYAYQDGRRVYCAKAQDSPRRNGHVAP